MTATGTLTITDFLLERIAEDEASASQYHRLLCLRTACDNEGCVWDEQERMADERVCTCGYPARVLAECKAKREVVKDHITIPVWPNGTGGAKYYFGFKMVCATCPDGPRQPVPCRTIRFLAAVYASHPDYDPAWASES